MFGLNSKKSDSKTIRQTENILAELQQELEDMDIQIINSTHNRNSILEKIKYFETKLESTPKPVETKVEVKSVEPMRPKVATVA